MKQLAAILLLASAVSFAQKPSAFLSQEPDNTARNKRGGTTADQQGQGKDDMDMTKKIRQAIMADKSLSTYGHNVKVVTKDGMVTLRGPVQSDEEKMSIQGTVAQVAGDASKVSSHLTVMPKKQ